MNDATGASGSGLAAVVVFEAIASGNSSLESSGDYQGYAAAPRALRG